MNALKKVTRGTLTGMRARGIGAGSKRTCISRIGWPRVAIDLTWVKGLIVRSDEHTANHRLKARVRTRAAGWVMQPAASWVGLVGERRTELWVVPKVALFALEAEGSE